MERDNTENYQIEKPTVEQMAWVFTKLNEFINEGGGTFRDLIYHHLGYEDYYRLLHGQELTNILNIYLEERNN